MVVEGIRSKPAGSVDWVVRGGAGGRVLHEEEYSDAVKRAVTSVAAHYGSRTVTETATTTQPDFSQMTAEQLRAFVQEHAPQLSEALAPQTPPSVAVDEDAIQAIVDAKLTEAMGGLQEALASQSDLLEERAQAIVAERESAKALAEKAHKLIDQAAGLIPSVRRDLRARYSVLPSGPRPALAECEATDEKTAEEVLSERLSADIDAMRSMVAEAQGRPVVSGQGASKSAGKERIPYWREQAVAEGVIEKPEEAVSMMKGGLA